MRLGVAICAGLLASRSVAGLVRGTVHEQGTPEVVVGAVARLSGSTAYAETDAEGRFSLEGPDGLRTLTVDAPGFETGTRGVRLEEGRPFVLDVSLARIEVRADEVVVRGRREAAQASQVEISRNEMKSTPGTAGDVLRAVQSLPGVAVLNDLEGQIAVRGGGPEDNLYLLDGIPWPVPFHFGGVMSTVNSELLQQVDLYAAAFDARWGNATGAILDARTRPGAKDRVHATANVNMVVSEGLVEAPLGLGDASVAIGGRRSYFDLIFGPLFRDTFTTFPRFWDIGGSLDVSVSPHDHVRAIGLAADDKLALMITEEMIDDPHVRGDFYMHDAFRTGGLTWTTTRIPGLTSRLTPYSYKVTDSLGSSGLFSYEGRHRVNGVREEASWEAGRTWILGHTVGFGGDLQQVRDTLGVYVTNPDEELHDTTVDGSGHTAGAWLQDRIQIGSKLALTVGGRHDRSSEVTRTSTTPRASVEWKAAPATTLRAAWGRYEQFPTGWELNREYGNPHLDPERAEHVVLGAEQRFPAGLFGRLEVYDKQYRRLVEEAEDGRRYANEGVGYARGVEVFLKEQLGERFFGWVSYAYSTSMRRPSPGELWARYEYDQPHVATAVVSWSPAARWRLGTKVRYNSGPLLTPLVGRTQNPDGSWEAVWGRPYSQRLADYVRCDARAEFTYPHDRWKFVIYVEILNVFGRANPAGVDYNNDYSEVEVINNLPRMPYLGVEARF